MASGDAGLVSGQDTLIFTVFKMPTLEVFAGEDLEVTEDNEATYGCSFTSPQGLTDMEFK